MKTTTIVDIIGGMTIGVLITTLIFLVLSISNTHTDSLNNLQDCINTVAQQEQYTGNTYSKQAWELFATSCTLTVYKK